MIRVDKVAKHFGGRTLFENASLALEPGGRIGLVGANGAGKTTTMKAITGLPGWAGGDVQYLGKSIKGVPSYNLLKQGLAMVPEGRGVFARMTIVENLQMGAFTRNDEANIKADIDRMFGIFPRLKERANQLAGTMSGGEQQMLAVGRILRTGANLLLLDEISEGLAPVIVQALARMILMLKKRGYTVVMVEQNFRFAAPLADRFYVMEHGRIVERFEAAQLQDKMPVLHELLGV